jgi:hypothetical protein
MKQAKPKKQKILTPEQRAIRNEKARERHWLRTGVSPRTVEWMRDMSML